MININSVEGFKNNYKTSFGTKNSRTHKTNNSSKTPPLSHKKINTTEGIELLLKGFTGQAVEMINSIIEHPLKSAALIGGTTLGLMALPLIGIPSAVGGGALALGFVGLAAAKTIYHASLFTKNNKKGTYDLARNNLQQIGQDGFDLALSAPFTSKAVTNIKNFSKFGKIEINKELITNLKSSKGFDIFKTLTKTDKELLRKINFQDAVEKELLALKDLSAGEKAKIKQELLDFNVETEKIPQVVLDKWSEIKGIKTQPDLRYESFPSKTYGCAVGNDCSIRLNDFKKQFAHQAFDDYQQIAITTAGEDYIISYKEKSTGKLITETIKQEVLQAYNNLITEYAKLSPQAQRILTMVHEREHIHQFAQIISKNGYEWIKHNITKRGRTLFDKMVSEMPKIPPCSDESMKVESYLLNTTSNTPAGYIKKPIEIGARQVETKALNHPILQKLNNVFTNVNKNINTPIEENIIINDFRFESANS